jgi:signal transduction histidine kinase
MLKIILRNLISNAIKFTNYGGVIEINSFLRKDEIGISIKDNGVGIEPQKTKNIFTSHENATTLGTQNEEGTGKGLALCKELIDRHQGRICVTSKKLEGSTFKIILPNKNTLPLLKSV